MKLVVRYIKDCYKALEQYNSVVKMNCKPKPKLLLDAKDQLKIIADEIIDFLQNYRIMSSFMESLTNPNHMMNYFLS